MIGATSDMDIIFLNGHVDHPMVMQVIMPQTWMQQLDLEVRSFLSNSF